MTQRKTFFIIVIALLLSAIGVYFAYSYIETAIANSKVQSEQTQAKTEPLKKLVGLKRPLTQGTVITETMLHILEAQAWQAAEYDYVLWDDISNILGQRLLVTLPHTAAIRYSDLNTSDFVMFSDQLKFGERAMTITTDALNSIYGYLQPNDKVDLLLVIKREAATQVVPLVTNVQVLATDTLIESNLATALLPNSGEISTLTLKVSEHEAHRIALGQTQGQIRVLLRNKEEQAPALRATTHIHELIPVPAEIVMIVGGAS